MHDARLLIPTLKDFFLAHPLINPKTFLGDAAFDSAGLYKALLSGDTFGIDEEGNGIHCCPSDGSLEMIYEGTSKLRSGITRYKFVCPKIRWEKDASTGKYHRACHCENPCTDSLCGRIVYLYPEKDLRAYPGTLRGTEEWDNTYKIRTTVERSINHIKDRFDLSGRKTQNAKNSSRRSDSVRDHSADWCNPCG